VAIKMWRC